MCIRDSRKVPAPALDDMIAQIRADEAADQDTEHIADRRPSTASEASVNAVSTYKKGKQHKQMSAFSNKPASSSSTSDGSSSRRRPASDAGTCGNCGRRHGSKDACPAKGKQCNKCGKPNHFGNVCRSRRAAAVTHTSSDGAEVAGYDDDEELPPFQIDSVFLSINSVSNVSSPSVKVLSLIHI